MADAGTNNGEN